MKILYNYLVFLLPFVSLGYFYNVFRNWAVNGSLYPLIMMTLTLLLRILFGKKIVFIYYAKRKPFLIILAIFLIVTTITTFIMSIYIDQTLNYSGYEVFKQPLSNALKIIPRDIIVFLIFIIIFIMIRSINDVTNTIHVLYLSFLLIIVYGYVQVLAIFNVDIFKNIYSVIWPLIDSGWAGEDRKIGYIFGIPRRINLTTPEASEASHYFQSAVYPFLLASVVSRYTVFKKKIYNVPIETILLISSIPLLLFTVSSAGYFIFAAQVLLSFVLHLKYYGVTKGIIRVVTLLSVIIVICTYIVIANFNDYFGQIGLDVITKVFSIENVSSNTRYALALAGLGVFCKFPLFGAGPSNTNLFMENYIPYWANANHEIINAVQTQAIPTLNFWVELLASVGILGSLLYFYLMYITIKPYVLLNVRTEYDRFIKCSFYLYLLSTIMHGFNSSNMAFMYIWVLWAFYISIITIKNSYVRS